MTAILHYFDGRGRAEAIRLTMAATKIKVRYLKNYLDTLFRQSKKRKRFLFLDQVKFFFKMKSFDVFFENQLVKF